MNKFGEIISAIKVVTDAVIFLHFAARNWTRNQGPVPISDKTSYCKISQSLEAARFVFRIAQSLWNLTGLSHFKAMRRFKIGGWHPWPLLLPHCDVVLQTLCLPVPPQSHHLHPPRSCGTWRKTEFLWLCEVPMCCAYMWWLLPNLPFVIILITHMGWRGAMER